MHDRRNDYFDNAVGGVDDYFPTGQNRGHAGNGGAKLMRTHDCLVITGLTLLLASKIKRGEYDRLNTNTGRIAEHRLWDSRLRTGNGVLPVVRRIGRMD
jgi:hypothetical protein